MALSAASTRERKTVSPKSGWLGWLGWLDWEHSRPSRGARQRKWKRCWSLSFFSPATRRACAFLTLNFSSFYSLLEVQVIRRCCCRRRQAVASQTGRMQAGEAGQTNRLLAINPRRIVILGKTAALDRTNIETSQRIFLIRMSPTTKRLSVAPELSQQPRASRG